MSVPTPADFSTMGISNTTNHTAAPAVSPARKPVRVALRQNKVPTMPGRNWATATKEINPSSTRLWVCSSSR